MGCCKLIAIKDQCAKEKVILMLILILQEFPKIFKCAILGKEKIEYKGENVKRKRKRKILK